MATSVSTSRLCVGQGEFSGRSTECLYSQVYPREHRKNNVIRGRRLISSALTLESSPEKNGSVPPVARSAGQRLNKAVGELLTVHREERRLSCEIPVHSEETKQRFEALSKQFSFGSEALDADVSTMSVLSEPAPIFKRKIAVQQLEKTYALKASEDYEDLGFLFRIAFGILVFTAGADVLSSAETYHQLAGLALAIAHSAAGPFLIGSLASCFAEIGTSPLDTIKVRQQLLKGAAEGTKMFTTAKQIVQTEGPAQLWAGCPQGCQRQFVYGGVRLGLYEPFKVFLATFPMLPAPVGGLLSGLVAGTLATVVVNPIDVMKVRRQGNGVQTGLGELLANEGFGSLYNGVTANMARGALITSIEFATFDQIVEFLEATICSDLPPIIATLIAGALSGVLTSLILAPMDVVKSRAMATGGSGKVSTEASRLWNEEGYRGFYKGVYPAMSRISGFAMIMFGVRTLINQYIEIGP